MPAQSFKPYVCTLDAASQKKAAEELKEDPKNRQGAIDTFRQWIQQQKHLKCPLDDLFLLAFLRRYHFSQLESRAALEKHMEMREKIPKWMKNLDTTSAAIMKLFDTGSMAYLGHDKEGRMVILFKPAGVDLGDEAQRLAMAQAFTSFMYYFHFNNEAVQVNGIIYVDDLDKYSIVNDMKMPLAEKKLYFNLAQKSYPTRMKGLHMFNTGAVIEILFPLVMSLLDDKLKERFKCHTTLESVYKDIPIDILPDEYHPDDYKGPRAGTHKQIVAKFKALYQSKEFRERVRYLSSEEFYIKIDDKDTDVPTASFRKLNVD